MARTPSFRKKGKLSLWLGVHASTQEAMQCVDILKDLCGVDSYDLDDQEVSAVDDSFPRAAVSEIIGSLSYSSSFIDQALERAEQEKISLVHWALAQFDFAYDPRRVGRSVAADPLFLGVFDWDDSEDDE